MNLTLEPETVTWPETHYVFVEKTGPFMDHRALRMADRSFTSASDFTAQQDHRVHEPLQDGA